MTSYLYHGSDVSADDLLKDMECQAGPEDQECEGKDFLISYGDTGHL